MSHYSRKVYIGDTDATGNVYFPNFFQYAVEAFEEWLEACEFPRMRDSLNQNVAFPVINANCDYRAPLKLGDHFSVVYSIIKIGRSSFTAEAKIIKDGDVAGLAKITHVCVDQQSFKKMEIPDDLREKLEEKVTTGSCQ